MLNFPWNRNESLAVSAVRKTSDLFRLLLAAITVSGAHIRPFSFPQKPHSAHISGALIFHVQTSTFENPHTNNNYRTHKTAKIIINAMTNKTAPRHFQIVEIAPFAAKLKVMFRKTNLRRSQWKSRWRKIHPNRIRTEETQTQTKHACVSMGLSSK